MFTFGESLQSGPTDMEMADYGRRHYSQSWLVKQQKKSRRLRYMGAGLSVAVVLIVVGFILLAWLLGRQGAKGG